MMPSRRLQAWICIVLLAVTDSSSGQSEPAYSPVQMPGSELRELHSDRLQRTFDIYVQLPLDYEMRKNTIYPVMYVTDANRSFPLFANISTILGFPDTGFPQVVVVGIAYPIESMADWAVLRTRDLTPTRHEGTELFWADLLSKMTGRDGFDVQTGGASRFLEFITEELIPFIESEYRVSAEDRALGGYSYGGLFSLYALFEKPQLFGRYFAGSPSLHYDDGVLFQIEEEFAAGDKNLQGKLFLTAGQLEGEKVVETVNKLSKTLKSRKYSDFRVHTHIFEGEDHRSAYAASTMRAFTWLYADQER